MLTLLGVLGLVVIVGGGWYALRRRNDVMDYHDLDEVRIKRHREGGA